KRGLKIVVRNPATQTKVNQDELASFAQFYGADFLLASTFQQFVSTFEDFFFDLVSAWLTAFPESLSKKQLDFGLVLALPDKSAVTAAVTERELNDLKYRSVGDWFVYLEKLTNTTAATPGDVARVAEIKASRDILVHNQAVVNAVYV